MDPEPEPLVDFTQVPQRLQTAVAMAAAAALLGCVIDGAINGLTFALMGRWAGIFVLLALFFGAAVTAGHALGGADRAGQRGERLAAPDVGLSPRRLEGRDRPATSSPPEGTADSDGAAAGEGSAGAVPETGAQGVPDDRGAHLEDTQRLPIIDQE